MSHVGNLKATWHHRMCSTWHHRMCSCIWYWFTTRTQVWVLFAGLHGKSLSVYSLCLLLRCL